MKYPKDGHIIARKKKGALTMIGGTSLDVNPFDNNIFILGTEGGTIFKCNIATTSFSDQFSNQGNFEGLQKRLRWRKEAAKFMENITNTIHLDQVRKDVERYCLDRGFKEVEPIHIFNSKPDMKLLYSIPFNFNYEKQYGPNQAISCSPFIRKIFLSCSIDGSIRMYDINNNRSIASFEPSANEYLMDVCFSPFRPAVFAAIGTKGKPYIYDLTISKKSPAFILEGGDDEEESKVTQLSGGVKISFNPKQRDFLAIGYMDGITKVFKLNYSLSNLQKNEKKMLSDFVEG